MEEGSSVKCAGRLVLMFEIDVSFALAAQRSKAGSKGSELVRGIATATAKTKTGMGGGSMDFRSGEIFGLRNTKGGIVLAEYGIDLLGEEGGVAELEGNAWSCGGTKRRVAEKGRAAGRQAAEARYYIVC